MGNCICNRNHYSRGSNVVNTAKSSALDYILRNCWEDFFSYLSNQEIGKLDSAFTEVPLREVFLDKVSDFYLANKIYSHKELEWILARNVPLVKCHMAFSYWGKMLTVITVIMRNLTTSIFKCRKVLDAHFKGRVSFSKS